ncbi:tetratricopeptide repeat protein [Maribellus comscasis]|uniref:Tetratricopeptide repeat protein n=1 Tax=Maribellus comscasis TaxID=2681766 RepID=A0A6I6K1C5_9BACT|nr:tetratricopeptide repeat protein [Maribellus comscasis]QGY47250.1 tetratricopeptide repeat protein [Maribellus comscasis]
MKRTIILLTFIFAAGVSFAQKGKVTSAQNFKDSGNLEKALETIKETIDPSNEKSEKTIDWPKTWEVRGEIYQAIYQSEDENVKKLAENPLATAFESYKKALELDEKGRFGNGLKIKLTLLTNDLTNQAVEGFNSEDYEKALNAFEQILEINSMPLIKGDNPETVDTVIIYNTGLAAYNAQQYDKAIKYYKEAAEYGYNGARTYSLIASAYQMKKDTLGALEILQEGFERYPEDNNVLTSMIQIYLDQDKTEDAMKYLEMAIEQDPDNATFYFAQGTLFEKLENDEKAIESYEKAIEVDSENYGAYYNLGALYYNKGVQQIEIANSVPANENERYLEETKKADIWWEKALPYMEKCNELKPDDIMTLESLKNLYYRMKQMDKYNEMLEKLGQ